MKTDPTFMELDSIKLEIINFNKMYFNNLKENEQNSITYFTKKVIFLKYLVRQIPSKYLIKALLSDFIYLIDSLINKNIRYYYLNIRSIIENTLRLVNGVLSSNTISVRGLVLLTKELLKEENEMFNINIIEDEYSKACEFVHGNINASMPLAQNYADCLKDGKNPSNMNRRLEQAIKLIDELMKILAYIHGSLIDSAFHRRKTILKYLTNNNILIMIKNT